MKRWQSKYNNTALEDLPTAPPSEEGSSSGDQDDSSHKPGQFFLFC